MLRRTIALALWAYFGWYLGSIIAAFTGTPAVVGPALGAFVAAFALVNWRRVRLAGPAEVLESSR